MIMSISVQLRLIIFSLIAGILTGILFDIYRVIRGVTNLNKFVTFIEDILFWILAGMIVFIFLIYSNYAYTDMYVYLLILFGIYVYFKLVSNKFLHIERNTFEVSARFIRIIKNIVEYPFQLIIYYFKSKNNKKCKK
ncbi:spore cortex biosynthesis protein YabQ [Clostridium sp.]|jgi:spore cortex biosynthesis protein YabQ|uniref:spore cortex biosynthesis protein YabQ n=1 Tax=Clostridium sp. TaxID=1506 RepID=UPI003A5C683F